jgi:sialic acid synthase SpsE
VNIGPRAIGPGQPVFILAEIGTTSMGDVRRACDLIDAAADAGADAIKPILTLPDKILGNLNTPYTYPTAQGVVTRPIGEVLRETILSEDDWRTMRDHAHKRGLVFFATTDHEDGVAFLETLDVPAHKSSSWDVAHLPLLRAMAATGKPVLVEIGTATAEEEEAVFNLPAAVIPVLAPHPTGEAGAHDWNMDRLGLWRNRIVLGGDAECCLAFSSPGRSTWCDFVALGAGACVIEKRLTLDPGEWRGHHHVVSLSPTEFAAWVVVMRRADAALMEDPYFGTPDAWLERAKYDRDERGMRR